MTLIQRNTLKHDSCIREADYFPEELPVIGANFMESAKPVKLRCGNCAREHHPKNGLELIDLDVLLDDGLASKIHPAKEYDKLPVASVAAILDLPQVNKFEFKCNICDAVTVIQ